jgi:hypothetical protein
VERVEVIEDFKLAYGKGRTVATVNRTLGVLRHAINWGMGRSPAVFQRSPFFRFGVKIKTKAETRRDRRVLADEEQRLSWYSIQSCADAGTAVNRIDATTAAVHTKYSTVRKSPIQPPVLPSWVQRFNHTCRNVRIRPLTGCDLFDRVRSR